MSRFGKSRCFCFCFASAEYGLWADSQIYLKRALSSHVVPRPPKMAKTASPSPSPGKLLEAKLLVARADTKAKAKSKSKKNPKTAKPCTSKQPENGDEGGSEVEVVEDASGIGSIK